jgi:hypothetical protein
MLIAQTKDCSIHLWQLIDTKELPLLQAVSPVAQKRSKSNSFVLIICHK